MTAEQWKDFVLKLLEHFDYYEGTTYLYLLGDRECFIKQFDEQYRPEIRQLLVQYHGEQA